MSPQRKSVRKFLFDRSFDDPGKLYMPGEMRRAELDAMEATEALAARAAQDSASNVEVSEGESDAPAVPPPPEIKYTQDDLDAAREDGFVAGHAKAVEEAATAREHYVADAINIISQNLAKLDEKQAIANRDLGETAMRLAFAVLRKIVPDHAKDDVADNINTFVKQVLPLILGEPKIVVRVHGSIVNMVSTRLKDVFATSSFQGGYTVVADFELQPGDCRLDWAGGGADRSEARIWAEVREVIAANYGDVDVDALDAAAETEAAAIAAQHQDAAT